MNTFGLDFPKSPQAQQLFPWRKRRVNGRSQRASQLYRIRQTRFRSGRAKVVDHVRGLPNDRPTSFGRSLRRCRSSIRKDDKPGTLLPAVPEDELAETDSLEATLPAESGRDEHYVPVRFESKVTELGMFELWCVSTQSDRRWKLEFSVRSDNGEHCDAAPGTAHRME